MSLHLVQAGELHYVALPPDWFRILRPPFPLSARAVLAKTPAARAVLDGAMLRVCAGEPHDYARYACGVPEYAALDPVTGVFVPSRYPDRGGSLRIVRGRASVVPGAHPASWREPGTTCVWQGYPRIVQGGRNVASTTRDTERTERAGVGIFADGRVVFVTARALSMWAFAEAARRLGIVELLYSDGGQSRVLAVRVGDRLAVDDPSNLDARRLPSFVAAIPPPFGA